MRYGVLAGVGVAIVIVSLFFGVQEHNERFGNVHFPITCVGEVQGTFNQGVAALHSFEYAHARRLFTRVAERDPACGMAHWGIAMTRWHTLWERPQTDILERGLEDIEKAETLVRTPREKIYVEAAKHFFRGFNNRDHLMRVRDYTAVMKKIYDAYPDDLNAAAFYALSLNAMIDPHDRLLTLQFEAGKIL